MRTPERAPPALQTAPRVLVVGPQVAMLRACVDAIGQSAIVRTCLGARAARRMAWTWDPTAIVLDHDPPALDAGELLRLWHQVGRFVPDVVLYARTSREGLETLARRHAGVHVLPAPASDGVLTHAVLAAHRASGLRRVRASSESGTRSRIGMPRGSSGG